MRTDQTFPDKAGNGASRLFRVGAVVFALAAYGWMGKMDYEEARAAECAAIAVPPSTYDAERDECVPLPQQHQPPEKEKEHYYAPPAQGR